MSDRKLDPTIGKLSPFLNNWQDATLLRLADNFAGFASSGVKWQRKDFQPLTVRHPIR